MKIMRWESVFLHLAIFLAIAPLSGLAGTIVGSYHDLDWADFVHDDFGSIVADRWNDYNQVCVYCHTPHNANPAVPLLWNRSLSEPTEFTPYSSESMDAQSAFPSSISLLCLSCHDGTVSVDAVINMPRTTVEAYAHSKLKPYKDREPFVDCSSCHPGIANSPAFGGYLTTDLSNDHPVSILYSTEDPGLVPRPVDGVFPNGIKLVDNRVECVSCHNVHDPDNKPFLRIPDTNSQLCFTCHIK